MDLTGINPEALREQAEKLETAGSIMSDTADQMRNAAEVLESLVAKNGEMPTIPAVDTTEGTRLEQLTAWLSKHGPLPRREIRGQCGLPRGTVGVLLSIKNFSKNSDGEWFVEEEGEDE